MSERTTDWIDFWDKQTSIYVNPLHLDVHYRDIANGIVALLPALNLRVMDYGCGDAVHADIVAAKAAELWLLDSSSRVRDRLARRFADNPRIHVIDMAQFERMPAGSIDVIVANSVVQYVGADDLDRLLAAWRRVLSADGTLIVGDVIPPDVRAASDVVALLRYAARNGFLIAAFGGLIRTAISPYRRVRAQLGMSTYREADFLAKLSAAGFDAQRLAINLEHNPARMSFAARPASD